MRDSSRREPHCVWAIVIAVLVMLGSVVHTEIAQAEDARSEVRSMEDRRPRATDRWRDATPEERREWRALARERWERATPRERRVFARSMRGLARALPEFTPIERRLLFRTMAGMSKFDRLALRDRLRRIDGLDPDERRRFVAELRSLMDESPEEAARLDRNIERWRAMPETERERYRAQMRRFRELSVEERERLLEEWDERAGADAKP